MIRENAPFSGADALCLMSAAELARGYADGSLSPVEVARAAMDRAEAINPVFNAFTLIDRAGAELAAAESARRWKEGAPLSPVDGVPTTLKDIVQVRGWPVRYGSTVTPDAPWQVDAPAVALLRAAGCVFIGQTTTPEFGWKAVTDSRLCGVTRNPWNADRTSGGSSGGAAVAAATGAGVFHLGTDGGGSIRVPASFCGISGLKPTFGRVPAYPASAFGTVAHVGPMTRSAGDSLAMLRAMSGRDLADWNQGAGRLDPLDAVDAPLKGARIGIWMTPPSGRLDAGVRAAVEAALPVLSEPGADVAGPVTLPGGDLLDLFHQHWFTGAAARLAAVAEAAWGAVDPGFLGVAAEGARIPATDLVRAQVRRAEFGAAMDWLLAEYDFIVSPAVSVPAFGAGLEVPERSGLARWTEWAGFSYPINLSQQPAATLCCGFTPDGLPVGLQIVGARGADARVLSAAACIEAALAARG